MQLPTIILAVATAAGTASAAFTSLAHRSYSPLNYQPLQARNGGIWVGGETETYCPGEVVPGCDHFKNSTAFIISASRGSMATNVPGGQLLYIGPKGSLGYTIAHSGSIPEGSYTTGFRRYPAPEKHLYWTFDGAGGATGFFACPQGKDAKGDVAYKVYADVEGFERKDCLSFLASRDYFDGAAAWQYE